MMKLNDALNVVKKNMDLQLKGASSYIPVLRGKPGIGKSTLLRELVKELDMNIYYMSGAKPLEYFSGLPETKDGETFWTVPEIIAKANILSEERDTVIFIDDVHIMDSQVQKYFFEFALERQLHGHKLRGNIAIIGAMNESCESGFEGFYAAVLNRFMFLNVGMEFEDWYLHMGSKLYSDIAQFLKANAEFREEDESTEHPFATFRSWTELSKILETIEEQDHELLYNISCGFVSIQAAEALRKFLVIKNQFDFKQILASRKIPELDTIVKKILFSNILRFIESDEDLIVVKEMIDNLVKMEDNTTISALILELKALSNSEDQSKNQLYQKLKGKVVGSPDIINIMADTFF